MNLSERGTKHVCPECSTKFYDLMREKVACPSCGATPRASQIRRSASPVKKKPAARTVFRYR